MEWSGHRQDEGTFLEDLSVCRHGSFPRIRQATILLTWVYLQGTHNRAVGRWPTDHYRDEVRSTYYEEPPNPHEARPAPHEIRPKLFEPQNPSQNRLPVIPAAEGMCPWKPPPPKQEVPQPQGPLAAAKRWKWEMAAKRQKGKKSSSQASSSTSAPKRAWACEYCPATFNSRQGRWEHRKKEHEGHRLDCPFDGCERILKSRSGMNRHIKSHYKELDEQVT